MSSARHLVSALVTEGVLLLFTVSSSVRSGLIVHEERDLKKEGSLERDPASKVREPLLFLGSFQETEGHQLTHLEGLLLFILAALTFAANVT